jgi:hypothetical protein
MTKYRGPVLVHASQRADDVSFDDIAKRVGVRLRYDQKLDSIVVITEIVDCLRSHSSK